MAVPDDAAKVMSALRLGWFLAETRGRNKPCGQLGADSRMPDHDDHALPLRIERTETELRIEAQKVVAQLATDLQVESDASCPGYSAAIDDKAKALEPVRAPKASMALRQALEQLRMAAAGRAYPGERNPPTPDQAMQTLIAAVQPQQRAIAAHEQALARALAAAQAAAVPDAPPVVREQAAVDGARYALAVLQRAIRSLRKVGNDATAAQIRVGLVAGHLRFIATAADEPWQDLAELLWKFDAHIQDQLSAVSETQACGYQLGRGLAETYWALDPGQTGGSQGWYFLLGTQRCNELGRLAGRLGAYLNDYTAPAINGSIEIWKQLAHQDNWRGDGQLANDALYRQIRRWYELTVLAQDPTTLIEPNRLISSYRTISQAVRLFWPQLVATLIGLVGLVALIVLLSDSGTAWAKAVSGILAALGLSLAGLTATLKNSAQAMLKRLRQDTYTDLVAIAAQTAPPPPDPADLRKALGNRRLTPATPN